MRLVRFRREGQESYGVWEDDRIRPIEGEPFGKIRYSGAPIAFEDAALLAPCRPGKIIAVGLNYQDHAKELKKKVGKEPILFLKAPSSVLDPGGAIITPKGVRRLDFEAELAVVIKKTCRSVTPKEAQGVILGYTCLNDVTARDLQVRDGQWARSKSYDTFSPIGPAIASGIDPRNLTIASFLNGLPRQASHTSKMIFDAFMIVSVASGVMTLMPGDVIATGTPAGVGPMRAGDTIEVRIEGIGSLVNTVV